VIQPSNKGGAVNISQSYYYQEDKFVVAAFKLQAIGVADSNINLPTWFDISRGLSKNTVIHKLLLKILERAFQMSSVTFTRDTLPVIFTLTSVYFSGKICFCPSSDWK